MSLATSIHGSNTHGRPDPQYELEAFFGNFVAGYIASGGLPTVPASSRTMAAFATTGYVVGSAGELIYVTQPALSITLANTNGIHWLALHKDTSSAVSNWSRRAGSHYLFRQITNQPDNPSGGLVFAKVTVAAGVITAVESVRIPASYRHGNVYDVTDPLFGAIGNGSNNDTAAVQATIDAASAGDTIYFPANKNFVFSGGGVFITKALTLVGSGSTITHTSSKAFTLQAKADIGGFTFASALTSTLVDIALFARNAAGAGYDISGTRIHDNTFGRVSTSIWDDDDQTTDATASGIWVYRNVWNGTYTNATPGDTYNLLDLRGWNDLYIFENRFGVINPERMMKISARCRRIHILDNTLRSLSGTNGKQCIDMFSDAREVIIANNIFDLNANETHCVEEKTGDGSGTFSEPSEILVTNNICKLSTTDTSSGAFAFFGSWGLASVTLTRSLCEVSNNLIVSTFTTNVQANITVRGFTNASVHDNLIWRDISGSAPTFTYGLEVSNCRTIHIVNNEIEYGIILVNGAASHPNATTYTGEPEAVIIHGNTQRSYKSLAAIYVPNATVIQLTITDNILDDSGGGSGSGGFLRLEATTVANLLMTGNQGFTQGATDIVLASAGAISTTAVVLNNTWQKTTVTWNPGVINNGASGFTNVTVLGAKVGDIVTVGMPYASQGAVLDARVSGAGSVLLQLWNFTGGNLTFGSGVWAIQTSRA